MPLFSAMRPPGIGTAVFLPLASIVTVDSSVALAATTSADPLPFKPSNPWPRRVSRASLKVQVMVWSSMTHSPIVWSAPL